MRSFGKNPCTLGWNLKPRTPCSAIRRRASSTPRLPLVRVDARERDQDVGVRARDLGDLLVRDARLPGERLGVDREDDGHHPALAVVARELGGGRPCRLAAEVAHGRVAQLVGQRVAAGLRHLDVRVHVDRDGVREREARASQPRPPPVGAAIAANGSSAVGSSSDVPARDGLDRLAAQDALDGRLELLARQRARDRGHGADRVGHVARRELRAQARGRSLAAQLVVQLDAVGEHDEQHELARAALVVLEVDDEAVA